MQFSHISTHFIGHFNLQLYINKMLLLFESSDFSSLHFVQRRKDPSVDLRSHNVESSLSSHLLWSCSPLQKTPAQKKLSKFFYFFVVAENTTNKIIIFKMFSVIKITKT